MLSGGVYYHNHLLTTPVLEPDILNELDRFDPVEAKPANIKRYITYKFNKDISYAQIAYEMAKRKQKMLGNK